MMLSLDLRYKMAMATITAYERRCAKLEEAARKLLEHESSTERERDTALILLSVLGVPYETD